MKQIKTLTNSFLLQELDLNGNVISELGFKKGGCSYLIKNNNIKFYLVEDYLYKNVIWSANIPLLVNGVLYSIDTLPIALKNIFILDKEEIEVDQELDSGSTNAIANHAVTVALNDRYTKSETNAILESYPSTDMMESAITASSEEVLNTVRGYGYQTSDDVQNAITSVTNPINDALTAHTSDTTIHVTASDKAAWDAKSDFSGSWNDLTDKPTNVSYFTNDAEYATSGYVDASVSGKQDTSGMTAYTTTAVTDALNSVVTAHTADTDIHVSVQDKAAWDAKLDADDVEGFFGAVTYDSSTQRINFYNEAASTTVLAYIDASDFVKDGFLESVAIENKTISGESVPCLVFVWNTSAGVQETDIPLASIFDPSNYFTKAETESAISAATSDMATETWVENQGYLTEHQDISGKQDISGMTAYTTTAVTDALNAVVTAHTANTDIHVTTAQTVAWDAKSDFSGSWNDLTDKPTNVSYFSNDAEYATSGYVDSAVSGKQDTSGMTAYTTTAVTDALNSVVTAHTADTSIHVTTAQTAAWDAKSDFSGSWNDLTDKPTNVSDFNNDAEYATSGYVDASVSGKQDTSGMTAYTTTAVTDALNAVVTAHTANTSIHVTTAQTAAWNAKADLSDIPTVTTAVTINSTDVVTSGGVYQQLGGMKIVKLTQAEYDVLPSYDSSTIYFIVG